MADFVFNIAKGRTVELYNRVKSNDPAASAFYLIPLLTAGIETDAVLIDKDDFAAVISGATDEATAGGWNRKTIDDTVLAALPAPDDTNDRYDVDMPDQTWLAVATANNVSALVLAYASVASPTNAQLLPVCKWDFVVVTDGSDVIAQVAAAGFFRAA